MKFKFLKKDNTKIIFTGDVMEIYIPKEYFKIGIAEYRADKVSTMGIFGFNVFTHDERKSGKSGSFHKLKVPFRIEFDYSETFTLNNKKLSKELVADDYQVFVLENGNNFVCNTNGENSAENSKAFIYLLHNGRLPNIIPYNEIIKLYLESITLNDVNLNNSSVIFEIIISELCRSKKDINIPFRKEISKGNVTDFDYTNINLKRLPSINSTFTAMTFEDMNQSIISSIKKNRNNENETSSPVEKTIKY